MAKLILGAAAATVLPLLAIHSFGLPSLPAPLEVLGAKGRIVLLESVRLA